MPGPPSGYKRDDALLLGEAASVADGDVPPCYVLLTEPSLLLNDGAWC